MVFNKNVNICLRCEQKTLNFNNEVIKSIGVEKDRVWSLRSSCHSALDSKREREGGETGGEGESEEGKGNQEGPEKEKQEAHPFFLRVKG